MQGRGGIIMTCKVYTEDEITHKQISEWVEDVAQEAYDDHKEDRDDGMQQVMEVVDGCSYVIYCSEASAVVALMSGGEEAEAFDELKGMGMDLNEVSGLDDIHTKLVYVYLEGRVRERLDELYTEGEDEETEE